MSVAQSFGICVPTSIAARMIEVPSGTVTLLAVDGQRDRLLGLRVRRAVIDFLDQRHGVVFYSAACRRVGAGLKSSGKCLSALITGYGVKPPSAQSEPNFMVLQRSSSTARFFARLDRRRMILSIGLDAAGRADPAGRALAAGFDGAELHRKARLLGHVDGVVEHDDAAMADQAVARGKRLIVERRIEQRAREIGAERTADLHRAHRSAGEACRRRCRRRVRRA